MTSKDDVNGLRFTMQTVKDIIVYILLLSECKPFIL